MAHPLIEVLVELATNPSLQDNLSDSLLEKHGVTDPAQRDALLRKDKAALLDLLGGATAELANNGTVYTLAGSLTGQTDQLVGSSLLVLDRTSTYDIQLGKNLRARVISGTLELLDSDPARADGERK
ncbi:MAG TPA: hypothetical protein VGE07_27755 [Herpetosiphonaceae bacterium]